MSDVECEAVADYNCVTGEGPLWHPDEERVYWVDIPRGRLFWYDPATGEHEQCFQGEPVGGFTLQADGSLLLFMTRGAIKVWREGVLETVVEEIPDERDSRFNDVIADPEGRVFCGTMPTEERAGRLYRLDADASLTLLREGVSISNGMGFTPDGKQLYHTDTGKRTIFRYDYDRSDGSISNQTVFAVAPERDGFPDGMTVDAEGYVWSARWDGGCVVRYTPEGEEERRIRFPARKVSCVTFGGDEYTDMYVTTAGGNNKAQEGSGAGALFCLTMGVRGVPEFRSRVGL